MANGKADASLVAAAYRMGMANVPKDLSRMFDSQLRSITSMYQAKADAFSRGMQGLAVAGDKIVEGKVSRDAERMKNTKEWNEENLHGGTVQGQIETLAMDQAAGVASFAGHYAKNGGPPAATREAAENEFIKIKEELKSYENVNLNKKQRKRQALLQRQYVEHRDSINNSLGSYRAVTEAQATGMVNNKRSFVKLNPNGVEEKDVEAAMLFSQVVNPDSNLEYLNIIPAYKEDANGKKEPGYYHTAGRIPAQRKHNMMMVKSEQEVENNMMMVKSEQEVENKEAKAMLKTGIIDPKSGPKYLWTSEKDLFAGVVMKDTETESALNGTLAGVIDVAGKYVPGGDNGRTKVMEVENYSEIQDDVVENYRDQLYAKKENAADLSGRKIMGVNWKEALQENREIDKAVVGQLGIGSDIFTMLDVDKSGSIGPDDMDDLKGAELKKHLYAKNLIIEQMTNPKTATERAVWAQEFAKFLGEGDNSITGQAFRKVKDKINPPTATVTNGSVVTPATPNNTFLPENVFQGSRNPSGIFVNKSDQIRIYNSIANKKQEINGADGSFYVLSGDGNSYMKFTGKDENTPQAGRKLYYFLNSKKGARTGKRGLGVEVSFEQMLENNAAYSTRLPGIQTQKEIDKENEGLTTRTREEIQDSVQSGEQSAFNRGPDGKLLPEGYTLNNLGKVVEAEGNNKYYNMISK